MKSLHVINRIYPEYNGGTEIHVYELCRALAQKGQDIVIFTQQTIPGTGITTQKKTTAGIKQYTLLLPPLSTKIVLIKNLFLKEFKLVKYFIETVRKEKPDIIHFHHLIDLSPWLLIYCWFNKIPYCIDLVDYWFICPDLYLTCKGNLAKCATNCTWKRPKTITKLLIKRIGNKRLKDYYGYLEVCFHRLLWKTVLNHFGGVLVPISERTRNIYRQNGFTTKMVVKPCGISYLKSRTKRNVSEITNLGYIGAIIPEKGIEILISAFKNIKNKNITLTLYGSDGYPKQALSSLVDEDWRIHLFGPFDHSDLITIIQSIDLLVVPSVWEETFGIVISEGQAAGIPVITTSIGGPKERIINSKNGFIVRPGNIKDLEFTILKIIRNYKRIVTNLSNPTTIFRIDDEAKQAIGIYSALINRSALPSYLFKKKDNIWNISYK